MIQILIQRPGQPPKIARVTKYEHKQIAHVVFRTKHKQVTALDADLVERFRELEIPIEQDRSAWRIRRDCSITEVTNDYVTPHPFTD